jgi:hypothetical protein
MPQQNMTKFFYLTRKVLIRNIIMKRWISAVGLVNKALPWNVVLQALVGQNGWVDILSWIE